MCSTDECVQCDKLVDWPCKGINQGGSCTRFPNTAASYHSACPSKGSKPCRSLPVARPPDAAAKSKLYCDKCASKRKTQLRDQRNDRDQSKENSTAKVKKSQKEKEGKKLTVIMADEPIASFEKQSHQATAITQQASQSSHALTAPYQLPSILNQIKLHPHTRNFQKS